MGKSIEALLNDAFTDQPPVDELHHQRPAGAQRRPRPHRHQQPGAPGAVDPAVPGGLQQDHAGQLVVAGQRGRVLPPAPRPALPAHGVGRQRRARAPDHRPGPPGLETVGALSGPLLYPSGDWDAGEAVQLYLEDMATDDLMRTFDALQCDFRLSVPYIARVVVMAGLDADPPVDVTTVPSAGCRAVTRRTSSCPPHWSERVVRLAIGIDPGRRPGAASAPWSGCRWRSSGCPKPHPVPVGRGRPGRLPRRRRPAHGDPESHGRFAITYSVADLASPRRGTPVRPGPALRPRRLRHPGAHRGRR